MDEEDLYKKVKLTEKEQVIQFLAVAIAAGMMLFFFVKVLFL